MERTVLELIKKSAAIPSMPQVATRFLEIVQDAEFDYREVVEVLSSDPGTVGEVLRLANSSLFGVTRQITSLPQALTLLGLKRTRSLILGRYIVDSINKQGGANIDISYYWGRSLATAVLTAQLSEICIPRFREEAFVAGLLADVGVVILDEALTDQYQPIAKQYAPHGKADLTSVERSLLGVTHAQVSAVVLEHWQLPEIMCEAVRLHSMDKPEAQPAVMAELVWAADRIAKHLCETSDQLDGAVGTCLQVTNALHLELSSLAEILSKTDPRIEEFAEILHVDVIPAAMNESIGQQLSDKLLTAIVAESQLADAPAVEASCESLQADQDEF